MTPTPDVQERLRKYLLGQLADGIREQVEKDLLANDELFEELLAIEDEIIDDYLGERLNASDRAAFENHFLATPERHEQLKFGRAFDRYLSQGGAADKILREPAPSTPDWQQIPNAPRSRATPTSGPWAWTQKLFSSRLRVAAVAIIVIGIALGAWRIYFHQSEVDRGLLALNAAYREQRPIESRISSLTYAPYSATRGPGSEKVDQNELRRAELTLLEELNTNPTPAVRHALGEVYLAKKEFDKAIEQFDQALKLAPTNAQLFSDLGAAWLEKGKIDREGKSVEDFARSLGYLNKALELDGNALEALFNRALCRQHLILWNEARDDWLEYLRRDPNSQWAAEARQNLKLLEERRKEISRSTEEIFQYFTEHFNSRNDQAAWRVISSYHNRSGNVVVERLLDAYLEAAAKGYDTEARGHLQKLSYIANLEEEKAGERFFSDIVRVYQAITSQQQASIVRARALLKSAHQGWGQSKVEDSLSLFVQAKELFDRAGDTPEAALTEYWISFCHYRQHNEELSLSRLGPLISLCERFGYKYLQVRTFYLLSILNFNLNEHSKAVEFANRSLALAEETGDVVGVLNAFSSLVEYFRYLGNYERSLAYIQRSLPLTASISMDPIQGIRVYGFQATALAAAGFYAAAAEYQKQALHLALTIGNVSTIAYSYTFLATINGKLQNYEVALQNAQLAYDVAAAHSNEPADRELMAYASLQTGNLYRQQENFQRAVLSYDHSIELYEELKQPTNLYQAHKGKLLCFVAQGDDVRAKSEIATALELVEAYRDKIFEAANRESFFSIEQNLYDVAIDFQYSKMKDQEESFRLSEMSRARSLLDLIHSDPRISANGQDLDLILSRAAAPLPAADIRRQLPSAVQILQYAVLKDKVIIWVISKDKMSSVTNGIVQEDLNEKVIAFLKLLSSASSEGIEAKSLGRELFNILIKPAEQFLDTNKAICVVPDKSLNYLPFAALISPSGHYLLEDYLLLSSPGSSVFIASSENALKKESSKSESLLSVGNPDFDKKAFPSLLDLPSAGREAREIADYYDSPRTLIGAEATVSRVRDGMARAEVIHLAAHSSLDERFPLRSKLLLSKEAGDSTDESVLQAHEIYGLKLERARLVVLSACQTGAERYYEGEGMISLARPFIVVDVPLVVASFWPVDSEATRDLMVRFHRNRKQNLSTVEALQRAQIEMLRMSDGRYSQPYYWAAFMVIGGYARF